MFLSNLKQKSVEPESLADCLRLEYYQVILVIWRRYCYTSLSFFTSRLILLYPPLVIIISIEIF